MNRTEGKKSDTDGEDVGSSSEIDVSSLNKSVRDVLENLESDHEVYGDETVKKATLKCLKHLQDEKELSHKDLKMNIYLDFLEDPAADLKKEIKRDVKGPPREDIWKMGKAGLDHIEKKTNAVESSIDKRNKIYRWKPSVTEMSSVEEIDPKNKSSEELNDQHFVEIKKQLQNEESSKEEMNRKTSELEEEKSYLIKEKKVERGLKLSLEKMEEGKGFILSSTNPKEIKRKYDLSEDSITYRWLTMIEGEKNFDPSNLPMIGHSMINFLERKSGLIFMEGIEVILKHNSFNKFWGFLNHLMDLVSEEDGILVISLDPRTLNDQQLAQIERRLEIL
ncbi:MAG: DUF835 domain-containing protein [Candidatus Thermoplasmatota archaeon]